MHAIDKEQFGAFVAGLRKEKAMTQRDLAQKLYVSDKAVSKWERGLALPDVALLTPLAEALGVTVAELLEGRRLEQSEPVSAQEAERLLRRIIDLSEEKAARGGPDRKKWAARYFLCFIPTAGELAWLIRLMMVTDTEHWAVYHPAALLAALSAGFGLYFCLFAKTRLPWYHDVGQLGFYYDGPVRMNVPGVRFTNRNWPHILRWTRVWCLLSMTLCGAVCLLAKALLGPGPAAQWLPMASLAGLVAAIYVPGRKYE